MESRFDLTEQAPQVYKAMFALETQVRNAMDPVLHELVKIRASQLSGCACCIDMHTKDARAAGETEQRIYALNAWRRRRSSPRPSAPRSRSPSRSRW